MRRASRSRSSRSHSRAAPHFRLLLTDGRAPTSELVSLFQRGGRLSARLNQGRVTMRSTAVALMLLVFVQTNAGCSLFLTKGPQPEVQPPPPCTTSNVAPALDTTAALLSAVVATAAFASTKSCSSGEIIFCSSPDNIGGIWQLRGCQHRVRCSLHHVCHRGLQPDRCCRTSLGAESPASSPVPESSFLLVPERQCPMSGDAPRICSSAAPWGPSAVVLGDVTSRGGAP